MVFLYIASLFHENFRFPTYWMVCCLSVVRNVAITVSWVSLCSHLRIMKGNITSQ